MDTSIYLPPGLTDKNVVMIDGVCYVRVGPSTSAPTVTSVDNTFDECSDCASSSSSSATSTAASSSSSRTSGKSARSSSSAGCTCQGPFGEEPDQYCLDTGSFANVSIGAVSADGCPDDWLDYFPELNNPFIDDILAIFNIPFVSKVGTVWTWAGTNMGPEGGGSTRYDVTVTIDTSTSGNTIKIKSGPYQLVATDLIISGNPPGSSNAGGTMQMQNSSNNSVLCTLNYDGGSWITLSCCGEGLDCFP